MSVSKNLCMQLCGDNAGLVIKRKPTPDLQVQLEYFYGTYVHVVNGSNVLDLCNNVMVRRDPLVFSNTLLR
ncbi:hypothetical protein BDR04DRAFT_1097431 [Suillus decipiens]|nr:hypothetical protein BDR04DRAFT_1097431 [Suillus decipiens]